MKAIIWKELRENLKWAALCTVVVALALASVASEVKRWGRNPFGDDAPTPMLIGAVFACLLGFLQVFVELRRDQWALLAHRPMTLTKVFAGKVIAFTILYLPVMTVLWTVFVVWCARPGHIAGPFDWRLSLPGYIDILVGFAYYFAGMLTGLRQARWYASKALGLGIPIILSVAAIYAPEFWHALVLVAVSGAILGVAAWGSFINDGFYAKQKRMSKVALGVALSVGICAAGVFIGAVLCEVTRPLLWKKKDQAYEYENYCLAKDGTVLRVRRHGQEVLSVVDHAGKDVERYQDPAMRSQEAFAKTIVDSWIGVGLSDVSAADWGRRSRPYGRARRYFETCYWSMAGSGRPTWFYSYRDGCFVEYDRDTRLPLGRLGPDGYVPEGQGRVSRFGRQITAVDFSGNDKDEEVFSEGVYRFNWEERTVAKVFEPEAGRTILSARRQRNDDLIAISTGDKAYLLNRQGDRLKTIPVDDADGRYDRVSIAALADGQRTFAWYHQMWTGKHGIIKPSLLVELSSDGTVLKRYELPGLVVIVTPALTPWPARVVWHVEPLVVVVGEQVGEVLWMAHMGVAEWPSRLHGMLGNRVLFIKLRTVLIWSVVFAVLNLLICWRRAFGRSAMAAWAVWGFLLGPTGLLLLCIQDWPARVSCHSCSRKRRVDRDNCEHCGSLFPKPALDGTEVFEQATHCAESG